MSELLTEDEINLLMNPIADGPAPAKVDTRPSIPEFLQAILTSKPGISDLNLSVGRPPMIAVDGYLEASDLWQEPLTAKDTADFAKYLMGRRPDLHAKLRQNGACDCSHSLPSGVRTRINVFKVRSAIAVVLRLLPAKIPTMADLGLPRVLGEIPPLENGLVLVTGATGSGKSTTMAAILDRVNTTRAVHVVALEDPIEFLHPHKLATMNQRELGKDFSEFGQALRAALRQGPKVIFVGEIRDRETAEIAIKAAETGHLVMSTMHTIDAGQTISRIVGMFPSEEAAVIRYRLSQVMRFIIGQRLLPKVNGGRIAVREIMGNDVRVEELIREGESGQKTYYNVIADAQTKGWTTFDQNITAALAQGLITEEVALAYSSDKSVINRERDRLRAKQGLDTSGLGELSMKDTQRRPDIPAHMTNDAIAPKRWGKNKPNGRRPQD